MKIKNIIFDLGGVILNINYQLTIQAFHQLGATHFVQDFTKNPEHAFFINYEIGKITSQQFRNSLRECLYLNVSDEIIDNAWNALLLDFPAERLKLLNQLKQQYRTFLYSNTNEIHINEVFNIAERQHGIRAFHEFFEKAYYSHTLGFRKPDPEGYLAILEENNLNPSETVFVDDLYLNITGAQKVGLHTIHINENQNLLDVPHVITQL